jgi:hypothetical protein
VWTQLLNNSWIFYGPQVDVVTILCYDSNPLDIRLQGIGKLQLHPGCTGYSPHTLLYGNTAVGNISLQLEDFLLQLDLNDMCCEKLRAKLNSYQTPVDIAYQQTTSHLEDLRSASTKVSELIRKVDEQDWKNHYVTYHSTYSALLLLVVSVGSIYLAFRLYNFTHGWKPICWHKQVITTPTDVVSGIELQNQEHNAHPLDTCNEDSVPTAKPASQVPPRASTTCAATSHY